MSENPDSTESNVPVTHHDHPTPPIGWNGQTLQEMLEKGEQLAEETGRYYGLDELGMKQNNPFEYERLFSRLRGGLVSARETALNISASAIVREIGELCFQVYTPEGDCVALSTGIIIHVHTGSLAIKHMIREDYEHDRGIEPGDIFCNNDTVIGNVHTSDVHTFVPVFHDDELIAWVDGVTHEVDIGGISPGHSLIDTTERYHDGLTATCEKIGENDQLYQGWKQRSQVGTRTPMYWELDEKCRIAGCHMIRDTITEIIDDVGADEFKQFMREAIEEGRQTLRDRVRNRLFPGTYRETSFRPLPYETQEHPQRQARQDMINHLPVEMEVTSNGRLAFDMEGASPSGHHAHNASIGSMAGGLWVSLTQCLLHDGKVNDGSHLAVDMDFPAGSIVNAQDPNLSYNNPWDTIIPTLNAIWKNMSRNFFARGYREEVSAGFGDTVDGVQGGGTSEDGEYWPISTFDHSTAGFGASAVADGLDCAYAIWNPESDMGDIEKWELNETGGVHLGRRLKPNTAGHGKYRGGAGWEGIRTFVNNDRVELFIGGRDGVGYTTTGMSGGYPFGTGYSVRAHGTDFEERVEEREPYPVDDTPEGAIEERIEGDVEREDSDMYFPTEFEDGDLLHWDIRGAPGFGDPMERPIEKVEADVEKGVYTPDVVERVYGVVGELDEVGRTFEIDHDATEQRREELEEQRRAETVPADEFWERERDRVHDRDFHKATATMYKGIFEQSPEWAEFFKQFWDLPDDYDLPDAEGVN